ncbi:MAG TPA: SRPBCC domain-containing protein [Thermoanaerobaculia bacterium]|nr:SRPBCC domain-containing protein [Thermoanaerobaculia bacterium]
MTTAKEEAPAKRSVEVEIEVPGTPEEVWQAIATGPGITAWFVPTDVEEREGGESVSHFGEGPEMDSKGVVAVWEPPRRVVFEAANWMPGAPPLAVEHLVEARGGGTCVVRLVTSLFTSRADWDDQLDSMKTGWASYLEILKLYLTHFPGRRCSSFSVSSGTELPLDRAWEALRGALGLDGAAEGERAVAAAEGGPALAGVVERVGENRVVLRVDQPGPGIAIVSVFACPGVVTYVHLYLYGDEAAAVAAREQKSWRAWMEERFPAIGPAVEAGASTAGG